MILRLSIVIILLILVLDVVSYKILVYSPKFGWSHMKFMGQIADTLSDAGHDVTVFQPILVEAYPGSGVEKSKVKSFGPDPRTKKLIGDMMNVKEVKNLWIHSAHSVMGVLWSAESIGKGSQYTCEMMLDNKELLEELRKENFDIAITELFDFSGFAVFHSIGLTNIVGAHTTGLFEVTALAQGIPIIPSYVPGSQSYISPDFSITTRITNIMMSYASWLFTDIIASHTQKCMNLKLGEAAPKLDDYISNITWVMTNSEPLFDFPRPILSTTIELGGIGAKPAKPLDEKWNKILSKRQRNVLISFGSVANSALMPDEYKASMVKMFETFPDVTFIWKYEKPGENEFVKHLDNVVLSAWLPQNDILGDKRTSLFLTHGGAGSIFESAINGVPLLVVAMFGDQMRNAKIVERHSFGVEYYKLELSNSEKLIAALRRVLTDDSYKKNAKYVSEIFKSRPFTPQEKVIKTIELAGKFGNDERFRNSGRKLSYVQYYNLDILLIVVSLIVLTLLTVWLAIRVLVRKLFGSNKTKKE